MWGGRLTGRKLVLLIVALGLLVELPLVGYIFARDDGPASVAAPENSGLGGASSALPLHPVAATFKPDQTTLVDCSEQTCFEQAYGNISFHQGPKVAFALVEQQYAGGADPSCHRVAHIIGAAALTRNHGNVARTFAEGSSTCWSGYYHGVLERSFADVKSYDAKTLGAKSRGLCADKVMRKSTWLAFQCLHGLGHGLMITTGNQLPLALDVCRQLQTSWDQDTCKGGAFMENIVTSYGGRSRYVRDTDLLYPCDWVERADKFSCYQNAGTRIVRYLGPEWETAMKTCAEAEKEWADTCFGSLGVNVSVNSGRDPSKIVRICALGHPYGGESECLRSAARDIAGAHSGGREAALLCDQARAKLRGPCYEAIGRMIHYLRPTDALRRAECEAITVNSRYASQCLAGAKHLAAFLSAARAG